MARPSNTDERRAQIVRGAMEVVGREGFERASVARIAKAAGLSPGLLHYHFDSKQAVLLALGDALVALVDGRLPAGELGPRAAVEAYVDAHLAPGGGANPAAVACWVALGAEAVFQLEVRALYQRIMLGRRDRLVGLLRDVCEAEGRSATGLDAIAASVLASIEGYFQIAMAVPELVPATSAAGAVKQSVAALLDAQPLTETNKGTRR